MEEEEIKIETIEELHDAGRISLRAFNILQNADIKDIEHIYNFYNLNGSFNKFRNLGKKTNSELIKLCKNYDKSEKKRQIIIMENEKQAKEDTSVKENIKTKLPLSDFPLWTTLSVRAKNVLNREGLLKIEDILLFIEKNKSFLKLKNLGLKTNGELNNFVKIIKRHIENDIDEFDGFNEGERSKYYELKNYLENNFNITNLDYERIKEQYINRKIKIFELIQYCAKNFFDNNRYRIFEEWNKFEFNNKRPTLQEIANNIELTRERVRQIITIEFRKFEKKLSAFFVYFKEIRFNYHEYFDIGRDYVYLGLDIKNKIKEIEGCDFNLNYVAKIFGWIYYDTFINITLNEKKIKHGEYLIKKDINDCVGLTQIIKKISEELKKRKGKKENININSLILQNTRNNDTEILQRAKKVIIKILINEFDIYPGEDDIIILKEKKNYRIKDCISDIMEENAGKVITLGEVHSIFTKRYAGIEIGKNELRNYILRIKNVISIGKRSTYMYRDAKNIDFKGGTLCEMTVDYLKDCSEPKHIYELTKHIKQYYPTNEKSLLYNLKLSKGDILEFYKNGFVGLKKKKDLYENTFFNPIPVKLYDEIIKYLEASSIEVLNEDEKKYMMEKIEKCDFEINKDKRLIRNLTLNDFVKTIAFNYSIKAVQVLSIIEPRLDTGEIYLDNEGRLNLKKQRE